MWVTALSSLGKLVKNIWAEYPSKMEGYFLIFIPVPLSQGEEGFLFLFASVFFFIQFVFILKYLFTFNWLMIAL